MSHFGYRQRYGRRARVVVAGGLMSLLMSCASMGPKTIPRDQFDYGKAIANSSKQQLLANMVGLRYVEAPTFVNVASVINQYSLEGQVSLSAGVNTAVAGDNTLGVGGLARYSDRPTITYMPVTGRDFAKSLLAPLPPESLFALVQAGWSPSVLLRLTVRSINGIENSTASPLARKQADSRFMELLEVWARLRGNRAIALRRVEGEKGARIVLYRMTGVLSQEVQSDLAFLYETLAVDPTAPEYELLYGLVPSDTTKLAVLTYSILELMNELAWRIDVPPEHVAEGRTGSGFRDEDSGHQPLLRVHYAEKRPADSFVAVHNRGYWFYIDDRDTVSKRSFGILQLLLSLTDVGEAGRGPVVSITN